MKSVLAVLLLALLFLLGAGSGRSGSGLRGKVVLYPASPVCKTGTSCTRPAAHVLLRFWRNGRVVAHTRTDSKGRFRVALRPRTYRVTAPRGARIKPRRVSVTTGRYRRVTFRLDSGIR